MADIRASGIEVAGVQLVTNIAGDSLGRNAFGVRYVSREVREFPALPGPPEGIVGWRVQLDDRILFDAVGAPVNPVVPFLSCEYSLHYDAEVPQGVLLVPVCISDPTETPPTPGAGPVFWFGLSFVSLVGGAVYVAPAVAIAVTGAVNFAIHCSWFQTGGITPPFDPAFPP